MSKNSVRVADSRLSAYAGSTLLWASLSLVSYFSVCLWIWRQILGSTDRHFVYPLDDPYIHLELARNISLGHYGINPNAASSPSSSLLWPLLLAPLAHLDSPLTALWLNLAFGVLTCVLIGRFVASMPRDDGSSSADFARRAVVCFSLLFTASLPALTFVGMEHVLQVFLSGLVAWGVAQALDGRRVPPMALLAAVILPSVRYEGIAISLALAVVLAVGRRMGAAVVVMVSAVIPLVLFSWYLHHLGLPLLPSSVMVKGQGHFHQLLGVAEASLVDAERIPLLVVALLTVYVAVKEKSPQRRAMLLGVALAEGLHLAVGPFGWFHRYEIAMEFFGVLILLPSLLQATAVSFPAFALASLVFVLPSVRYVRLTAAASGAIFRQQWQMARFSSQFMEGNVAINDLGLVSYMRRPGEEVVDLYGLGSVEALRQRVKTPQWLDSVTTREHVSWVIVYSEWFPNPPAAWHMAGNLCLPESSGIISYSCVRFYSTKLVPADEADQTFRSFAATLPSGAFGFPAH